MKNYILITGCAGFIGYHLALKLLKSGANVIGIDNLNDYYDTKIKKKNIKELKRFKKFYFFKVDLLNIQKIKEILKIYNVEKIINLAAQAGVRFSQISKQPYIKSNIIGFLNILEICKEYKIKFCYFASTSSVYGENKRFPLKEEFNTSPVSFYAATKVCNEIFAELYSKIISTKFIGLRFFTVYGPNGRPDMSIYKFVKNLFNNKKINIFNGGKHSRDYSYIDDIVDAIFQLLKLKKKKFINYQVFNVAKGKSETLMKKIKIIEKITGKKFKKKFLRKQDGDIIKTHADITKLKKLINFNPKTKLELGLTKFINWYKQNSDLDY